jgi:probable rRNA maturation factor
MTFMKRHSFLTVTYQSTVKLTPTQKRKLDKWLDMAGDVIKYLFTKKIISDSKINNIQVSLLICGDARMRQLNRSFRNKDKVTDILSFPAHEDLRKKKFNEPVLFLGDLAICHPQTKRQANEFEISYMDEFIHLFFHGMIHLMGYDHEVSLSEEKLMQKWEERALKKFSAIKKGAL